MSRILGTMGIAAAAIAHAATPTCAQIKTATGGPRTGANGPLGGETRNGGQWAGAVTINHYTVEDDGQFTCRQLSHYVCIFLTEVIVRLCYVELDGPLSKIMVVIKMRGGNHSKDIREYVITDKGVVVIHPRTTDYVQLSTGIPAWSGPRTAQPSEAPPEPKAKQ